MKKQFSLIVACIALALISCDKKEDTVASAESSITVSGTVSGEVANYAGNESSLDSIYATCQNTVIAKGKIADDGKFTINLTQVPQLQKYGTVEGATVSDTNAQTASLEFFVYKDKVETGGIMKCKFTTSLSELTAGMNFSEFIYSDRPFTVKGTISNTVTANSMTITISTVYDITYKKGWNEVVHTYNNSISETTITTKTTSTNTIPSDFKWTYFNTQS